MTGCLFCAASEIEKGSLFKVHYNSSRSEEEQTVVGKVRRVTARRDGTGKVVFKRDDGQVMEVQSGEGRLISYGSHAPTTGFAYRYEVIDKQ